MTDKTWDCEDARELPYRFAPCPITGEVFIITLGRGFGVMGYFENKESFYRFLTEGNKTASLIRDPIPETLKELLGGEDESSVH